MYQLMAQLETQASLCLMKPSNLFEYVDLKTDLLEDTYLGLIIIKRYDENARSYSVKKYNLINSNALEIKPRDEVFFLSNNDISFLILRIFMIM